MRQSRAIVAWKLATDGKYPIRINRVRRVVEFVVSLSESLAGTLYHVDVVALGVQKLSSSLTPRNPIESTFVYIPWMCVTRGRFNWMST